MAAPITSAGRFSPLGPRGIKIPRMRTERVVHLLKLAVALPVYLILDLIVRVKNYRNGAANIATVVEGLIVLIIATISWAFLWILSFGLILQSIK